MELKKYASLDTLQRFLENLKTLFLSKTEAESYEFITTADIDEICGGVTEGGLMQNDVDELMAQLQ